MRDSVTSPNSLIGRFDAWDLSGVIRFTALIAHKIFSLLSGAGKVEETVMNIVHDGANGSPLGINGVNATVWLLAATQSQMGHQVALLLRDRPTPEAHEFARARNIELILPSETNGLRVDGRLRSAFGGSLPDVVHMHSVFIPGQAMLARQLVRLGIPYILTPHGGLAGEILGRGRVKKSLYVKLVERPRCAAASALTASFGEEREIRRFLKDDAATVHQLPIPLNTEQLRGGAWGGNIAARRFVFLGRFDVRVKGIDRLVEVAGLMRDHEFHLYGEEDPKTREQFQALNSWRLPNVFFHPPVFGDQKLRVLIDASMYIQLSRSESFGIAIAEAMYLGVPCAISDEINLADTFVKHDLGLTLSSSAGFAAHQLTRALKDPEKLRCWSDRSWEFGRAQFDVETAVTRYVHLYEEVLAGNDSAIATEPLRERMAV